MTDTKAGAPSSPAPLWAADQWAMVRLHKPWMNNFWLLHEETDNGGYSIVHSAALHPLPALNADDEAVLRLAAKALEAREKSAVYWSAAGLRTEAEAAEWAMWDAIRSRRHLGAVAAEGAKAGAWVPKVGDRVRIEEGAYAGLEATILRLEGDSGLLDMGAVETDSTFGRYCWMLSNIRNRASLATPPVSGAIEAAREAVVAAAVPALDAVDWNIAINAVTDDAALWRFINAVKEYKTLLAPPSPPDAVGELVEAAYKAASQARSAANQLRGQGCETGAALLDEATDRLRAAIARAKEGRT